MRVKPSLRLALLLTLSAVLFAASPALPAAAQPSEAPAFVRPIPPSPSDVTAAASTGMLQASGWTLMPAPGGTTDSLNAIAMASATDGWIVGDNGVAFHWNGQAWQSVASNFTGHLNSVSVVPGSGEAWAVGQSLTPGSTQTILHFVNGAWMPQSSPVTAQLDTVWMTSTTDGWAMGAGGTILHYQNGTWTQVQPDLTPTQFHAVQMLTPGSGFAVGGGGLYRYDGSVWSHVPSAAVTSELYGLWMTSGNDGWVVGASGAVLHYQNGTLTPATLPFSPLLYYVFMVSPTEGWATATGGYIFHYTGGQWVQAGDPPSPGNPLSGVWMVSANEGWAVGWNGTLLHYSTQTQPTYKVYLPNLSR